VDCLSEKVAQAKIPSLRPRQSTTKFAQSHHKGGFIATSRLFLVAKISSTIFARKRKHGTKATTYGRGTRLTAFGGNNRYSVATSCSLQIPSLWLCRGTKNVVYSRLVGGFFFIKKHGGNFIAVL